MTDWIDRVSVGSVTAHLRRTWSSGSNLEPVGIGIEERCEFAQPRLRCGVPRLAGKSPRQFRFRTNCGNRLLTHKPRHSPHIFEEGPPFQGRRTGLPFTTALSRKRPFGLGIIGVPGVKRADLTKVVRMRDSNNLRVGLSEG